MLFIVLVVDDTGLSLGGQILVLEVAANIQSQRTRVLDLGPDLARLESMRAVDLAKTDNDASATKDNI